MSTVTRDGDLPDRGIRSRSTESSRIHRIDEDLAPSCVDESGGYPRRDFKICTPKVLLAFDSWKLCEFDSCFGDRAVIQEDREREQLVDRVDQPVDEPGCRQIVPVYPS